MNTIDRKYLLFLTQTAFEEALRMGNVRDDSIVFIKSPKLIYTHGTFWDCSKTENDSDFQEWFSKQDVPTKKWIQEYVDGKISKIPAGKEGVTYTAGEGIAINGTTISSKVATSLSLGGIKLGYVKSGNNVPVQVNGLNQAYVLVPANTNPGGPGSSSPSYYEMMFKTTDTEDAPTDLPTSSSTNGWKQYAENSDGTKVVWMIVRLIDNGVLNPWEGPWRISGPSGENGVDGDKQEFIYRLSNSGTIAPGNYNSTLPDTSSIGKTINDDDFVPVGWTDSPSGINTENRYEWMSMRFKTFTKENPSGSWSQFIPPVLWSAYGLNGMDGDGVEYIFYSSLGGAPTTDPYDWTADSGFQRNEYIRVGAGAVDSNSLPNRWQDDPYNLDLMTPGAKTYVSMRKRTTNNGVQTWGPYTHPSLWAYYSKNGDAGIGVVADFDNDTMCVSLKSNGTNYAFVQTSKVYLYNGINTVSCSALVTGAKWSDGTNIPNYSEYFSIQNTNQVRAYIQDGYLNFGNHGSIFVDVTVSGTINNATVTRTATLLIIGINFGEDGRTYSLNVGSRVIRKNKSGQLSPSAITCECTETKGADVLTTWNATNKKSGFSFTKIVDDDFQNESDISTASISTEGVTNNIIVRLKYDNGSTIATVDQETIYVISDGVDGGLIPAVHYDIMVQSTTLSKVYVNDSARLQGKVTWKAYKIEGTTRTEITSSNKSSLGIDLQFKYGNNSSPAQWSSDTECWYVNLGASWNDAYSFSLIIVKVDDVPVASTVIPTIISGKDGKDAENLQTLNGTVMRLTVWQDNPTHPYRNGTFPDDGIYYLDVVQYGNELFKCIVSGTTERPYAVDGSGQPILDNNGNLQYSQDWFKIETMSDAAFHTLLVNDAYITNLTAKQIVVTGKEGTNYADKPVAGIVNNTYIESIKDGNVDNGIRIFAGSIPESGNLAGTAFNVDQLGTVKAGGGKILLNPNGSGYVAGGKISWDQNGNITAFGINPHTGGADLIVNSKYKQMLYITNITEIGNYSDGEDVVKPIVNVRGFIIINGWVVSPFSCDGYVNIGIGASKHITTENIISAMRRDNSFLSLFTDSSGETLFKSNADIYVVSPTYVKLKYGNLDEEQYSVESTYITSLYFYGPVSH